MRRLPSRFAALRRCYSGVPPVLTTTRGAFGIATGIASRLLRLVAGADFVFCETDCSGARSEELEARISGAGWVAEGCSGFCETDSEAEAGSEKREGRIVRVRIRVSARRHTMFAISER